VERRPHDQTTIDLSTTITFTLEAAMQFARTLRFLAVSMAIPLATALSLACSEGDPTGVDQSSVLASGRAAYVDDDGKYYCPSNYLMVYVLTGNPYESYDLNGNHYICEYHQGSGGGRPLRVDDTDNACPSGYDRTATIAYDFNDLYDFNQNDYICLYVNKKYT
jgi:hypothetical protein